MALGVVIALIYFIYEASMALVSGVSALVAEIRDLGQYLLSIIPYIILFGVLILFNFLWIPNQATIMTEAYHGLKCLGNTMVDFVRPVLSIIIELVKMVYCWVLSVLWAMRKAVFESLRDTLPGCGGLTPFKQPTTDILKALFVDVFVQQVIPFSFLGGNLDLNTTETAFRDWFTVAENTTICLCEDLEPIARIAFLIPKSADFWCFVENTINAATSFVSPLFNVFLNVLEGFPADRPIFDAFATFACNALKCLANLLEELLTAINDTFLGFLDGLNLGGLTCIISSAGCIVVDFVTLILHSATNIDKIIGWTGDPYLVTVIRPTLIRLVNGIAEPTGVLDPRTAFPSLDPTTFLPGGDRDIDTIPGYVVGVDPLRLDACLCEALQTIPYVANPAIFDTCKVFNIFGTFVDLVMATFDGLTNVLSFVKFAHYWDFRWIERLFSEDGVFGILPQPFITVGQPLIASGVQSGLDVIGMTLAMAGEFIRLIVLRDDFFGWFQKPASYTSPQIRCSYFDPTKCNFYEFSGLWWDKVLNFVNGICVGLLTVTPIDFSFLCCPIQQAVLLARELILFFLDVIYAIAFNDPEGIWSSGDFLARKMGLIARRVAEIFTCVCNLLEPFLDLVSLDDPDTGDSICECMANALEEMAQLSTEAMISSFVEFSRAGPSFSHGYWNDGAFQGGSTSRPRTLFGFKVGPTFVDGDIELIGKQFQTFTTCNLKVYDGVFGADWVGIREDIAELMEQFFNKCWGGLVQVMVAFLQLDETFFTVFTTTPVKGTFWRNTSEFMAVIVNCWDLVVPPPTNKGDIAVSVSEIKDPFGDNVTQYIDNPNNYPVNENLPDEVASGDVISDVIISEIPMNLVSVSSIALDLMELLLPGDWAEKLLCFPTRLTRLGISAFYFAIELVLRATLGLADIDTYEETLYDWISCTPSTLSRLVPRTGTPLDISTCAPIEEPFVMLAVAGKCSCRILEFLTQGPARCLCSIDPTWEGTSYSQDAGVLTIAFDLIAQVGLIAVQVLRDALTFTISLTQHIVVPLAMALSQLINNASCFFIEFIVLIPIYSDTEIVEIRLATGVLAEDISKVAFAAPRAITAFIDGQFGSTIIIEEATYNGGQPIQLEQGSRIWNTFADFFDGKPYAFIVPFDSDFKGQAYLGLPNNGLGFTPGGQPFATCVSQFAGQCTGKFGERPKDYEIGMTDIILELIRPIFDLMVTFTGWFQKLVDPIPVLEYGARVLNDITRVFRTVVITIVLFIIRVIRLFVTFLTQTINTGLISINVSVTPPSASINFPLLDFLVGVFKALVAISEGNTADERQWKNQAYAGDLPLDIVDQYAGIQRDSPPRHGNFPNSIPSRNWWGTNNPIKSPFEPNVGTRALSALGGTLNVGICLPAPGKRRLTLDRLQTCVCTALRAPKQDPVPSWPHPRLCVDPVPGFDSPSKARAMERALLAQAASVFAPANAEPAPGAAYADRSACDVIMAHTERLLDADIGQLSVWADCLSKASAGLSMRRIAGPSFPKDFFHGKHGMLKWWKQWNQDRYSADSALRIAQQAAAEGRQIAVDEVLPSYNRTALLEIGRRANAMLKVRAAGLEHLDPSAWSPFPYGQQGFVLPNGSLSGPTPRSPMELRSRYKEEARRELERQRRVHPQPLLSAVESRRHAREGTRDPNKRRASPIPGETQFKLVEIWDDFEWEAAQEREQQAEEQEENQETEPTSFEHRSPPRWGDEEGPNGNVDPSSSSDSTPPPPTPEQMQESLVRVLRKMMHEFDKPTQAWLKGQAEHPPKLLNRPHGRMLHSLTRTIVPHMQINRQTYDIPVSPNRARRKAGRMQAIRERMAQRDAKLRRQRTRGVYDAKREEAVRRKRGRLFGKKRSSILKDMASSSAWTAVGNSTHTFPMKRDAMPHSEAALRSHARWQRALANYNPDTLEGYRIPLADEAPIVYIPGMPHPRLRSPEQRKPRITTAQARSEYFTKRNERFVHVARTLKEVNVIGETSPVARGIQPHILRFAQSVDYLFYHWVTGRFSAMLFDDGTSLHSRFEGRRARGQVSARDLGQRQDRYAKAHAYARRHGYGGWTTGDTSAGAGLLGGIANFAEALKSDMTRAYAHIMVDGGRYAPSAGGTLGSAVGSAVNIATRAAPYVWAPVGYTARVMRSVYGGQPGVEEGGPLRWYQKLYNWTKFIPVWGWSPVNAMRLAVKTMQVSARGARTLLEASSDGLDAAMESLLRDRSASATSGQTRARSSGAKPPPVAPDKEQDGPLPLAPPVPWSKVLFDNPDGSMRVPPPPPGHRLGMVSRAWNAFYDAVLSAENDPETQAIRNEVWDDVRRYSPLYAWYTDGQQGVQRWARNNPLPNEQWDEETGAKTVGPRMETNFTRLEPLRRWIRGEDPLPSADSQSQPKKRTGLIFRRIEALANETREAESQRRARMLHRPRFEQVHRRVAARNHPMSPSPGATARRAYNALITKRIFVKTSHLFWPKDPTALHFRVPAVFQANATSPQHIALWSVLRQMDNQNPERARHVRSYLGPTTHCSDPSRPEIVNGTACHSHARRAFFGPSCIFLDTLFEDIRDYLNYCRDLALDPVDDPVLGKRSDSGPGPGANGGAFRESLEHWMPNVDPSALSRRSPAQGGEASWRPWRWASERYAARGHRHFDGWSPFRPFFRFFARASGNPNAIPVHDVARNRARALAQLRGGGGGDGGPVHRHRARGAFVENDNDTPYTPTFLIIPRFICERFDAIFGTGITGALENLASDSNDFFSNPNTDESAGPMGFRGWSLKVFTCPAVTSVSCEFGVGLKQALYDTWWIAILVLVIVWWIFPGGIALLLSFVLGFVFIVIFMMHAWRFPLMCLLPVPSQAPICLPDEILDLFDSLFRTCYRDLLPNYFFVNATADLCTDCGVKEPIADCRDIGINSSPAWMLALISRISPGLCYRVTGFLTAGPVLSWFRPAVGEYLYQTCRMVDPDSPFLTPAQRDLQLGCLFSNASLGIMFVLAAVIGYKLLIFAVRALFAVAGTLGQIASGVVTAANGLGSTSTEQGEILIGESPGEYAFYMNE